MATSLDMSLDDLIKSNPRNNGARGRGRGRSRGRGGGDAFGRGRGMGMTRRGPLRVNARSAPYTIAKPFSRAKDFVWQHDMFEDSMIAAGIKGIETGTKLYISNLDYGVSNEDIKELFSEVGDLKRCAVHYDRNGRSSGSAEVVFTKRSDALAALKKYNNVQLDGKPMKIELIGTSLGNLGMPISARINVIGGANGRGRRTVVMTPKFGRLSSSVSTNRGLGWNRGGFRRGRGRGRGRGWGQGRGRGWKLPPEISVDDLDKELENYHAEAMQTS